MTIIAIPNANGIHIGAVTHHQDQSITFVSFNTIKTIVKSPEKLIPPARTTFFSLLLII